MHNTYDAKSLSFLLSSTRSDAARGVLYELLLIVCWRSRINGKEPLAVA